MAFYFICEYLTGVASVALIDGYLQFSVRIL